MKKILFFVFALLPFSVCNAQEVKTQSNFDVNGDGSVTLNDVTSTVNKVLGVANEERTLVDAVSLNALLLRLEQKLDAVRLKQDELMREHELIREHFEIDPYRGHEYVDLGLSVKWATCNVGAELPSDCGKYYAWGETLAYGEGPSAYPTNFTGTQNSAYNGLKTKTKFSWDFYKYCDGTSSNMTKYYERADPAGGTDSDNKTVLEPQDDAAHVNWGGRWRMPTIEEMRELIDSCYWQQVTTYNGVSVNGYIVYKAKSEADKGKNSGKYPKPTGYFSMSDPHIFLPTTGECYSSGLIANDGKYAFYWTSTVAPSGCRANYLLYQFSDANGGHYNLIDRCEGHSIRPVCK